MSIEQSIKEPWQKTELDEIKLENYLTDDQIKEKETLNIHVISQEPNSENQHEYISYREEQDKDEDIIWIKNLILKHEDKKPVINQFDNEVRRILYKEYNNLRVIEDLVYRTAEDREGFMRTHFVLPKKITDRVIMQIHSSLYNAHLGRKKTSRTITERIYRPLLAERIKECLKTCDSYLECLKNLQLLKMGSSFQVKNIFQTLLML